MTIHSTEPTSNDTFVDNDTFNPPPPSVNTSNDNNDNNDNNDCNDKNDNNDTPSSKPKNKNNNNNKNDHKNDHKKRKNKPFLADLKEKKKKQEFKSFRILALYKFVNIPTDTLPTLQKSMDALLRKHYTTGSILMAPEGINGTICYPYTPTTPETFKGTDDSDDPILSYLHKDFKGLRTRISYSPYNTFHRLKVKLKKEICTMGELTEENENDTHNNHHNTVTSCSESDTCHLNPDNTTSILSPCNTPVGEYISPQEWNKLLLDPDVAVIDTRNDYEIHIGTFQNAINPNTTNFKQFPAWLQNFSKQYTTTTTTTTTTTESENESDNGNDNDNGNAKPKRKLKAVAMFCTGGIRCEKATAYALSNHLFYNTKEKHQPNEIKSDSTPTPCSIKYNPIRSTTTTENKETKEEQPDTTPNNNTDNNNNSDNDNDNDKDPIPIYHLEGGILAYLQQIPPEQSLFHGDCFVFDQRVSVHGQSLEPGQHTKCHGCRKPLTPLDLKHADYVEGVMCHYCANDVRLNEKKQLRMKERQKQMELAADRGVVHIHDPKNLES